jgi:hypothetical protein
MDSNNAEDDFDMVRATYHDLLAKGGSSLEDMMEVARATEHPRAFEVLSGMMKNMADISGNLMDMHKKRKEFQIADKPPALPGTTNNNVFVGSTTDLQRMLKDVNEKMIDVSPAKEQ